jgi:drug/metabolite transporter (DMT)-like permease
MLVHHRRRVRHIGRTGDLLTEASDQRRQRLMGIALMCGAVACFSCLDTTAKYLNTRMETLEVVWARYTGAFVLAFIISNPLSRPDLMRTTRPGLQIVRSALLLFSTILGFFALRFLRLDQNMTILFSTPFFVAVLSGPFLGEWVGWRRWTAIGVGFLGVLVVIRPGLGGIHPAALLSMCGAVLYGFYNISTRLLARTDSTQTTLFYSNLVGALALLPVLPAVWTTPRDPLVILLMVTIGAFGSLGHYLLIVAIRLAPPMILSPFIYTQLVWSIALGYLVFGDRPDHWTQIGSAIVVSSGLYILYREQKVAAERTKRT